MSTRRKLVNAIEDKIFDDLFFEQSTELMGHCYRHGLCRSIFVLVRSLFLSPKVLDLQKNIRSKTCVALTFFPNEYRSIKDAPPDKIKVDSIIKIDLHKMSFVRDEIGWLGILSEFFKFTHIVIRTKGLGYLARMTHPFLGWLMYKSLNRILRRRKNVTVITTNMVHPMSIGVTWACLSSEHKVDFWEHAVTPKIIFNDRGYRHFYVNFQHTKNFFLEKGVLGSRVTVIYPDLELSQASNSLHTKIVQVGICINYLDSIASISMITSVVRKLGLKPSYRIHDSDPRVRELKEIAIRENINVSLAREVVIRTYLESVDLVVAGNSNVITDSILCSKPVVYFWSGETILYDFYGLIKYFNVPSSRNPGELEFQIRSILLKVVG